MSGSELVPVRKDELVDMLQRATVLLGSDPDLGEVACGFDDSILCESEGGNRKCRDPG